MTRDTSNRGLLRRHLESGLGVSILVAVLVAVTVFVIALAPRAFLRLGTDELRFELSNQVPARIDLTGSGPTGLGRGTDASSILGPTDSTLAELPSRLPSPLSDGAGETRWLVRTGAVKATLAKQAFPLLSLKLAVDLRWADGIRIVDGEAPTPWTGSAGATSDDGVAAPIEIALARESAEAMDAEVGDLIDTGGVPYLLTGTYEVVDPDDRYWQHARDLLEPARIRDSGLPLKIQATAYLAPDSIDGLRDEFSEGELSAWIPIDPEAYDYADLTQLGTQVRVATSRPVMLPEGGQLAFRSAFSSVLDETEGKVAATSALIALSASGFLGVLVAAYALCIQAVIRRRRVPLALASARGAAPRQLRTLMTLEALLIAVPGSIAAIGIASVVIPESVGVAGWVAPIVIGLIPVALAAVLTRSRPVREGRDDLGSRWDGSTRWVVEVAVLALAAVAVFLLQRRGLVASSAAVGIDPLLSAMPVLLAVAAGLLVLRIYPVPLRAVHRAVRASRAPVASVGSARAVREPAVGLIGTLALVTGIAIAVFGTVMISTVDHGLRQSARDQVGADLQIEAHDLPDVLVDRLTDLPGVGAAVALRSATGIEFSDEFGPSEVSVLLADTAALHRVRPDIPALAGKVDGRLPILVSSDWANQIEGTELHVANSTATQQGVIAFNAVPGMTRHWILVDVSAADELGLAGEVPHRVLARVVDGVASADVVADVTRVVVAEQPEQFAETVAVDDADSLIGRLRAAPITSGLETSLVIVSLASLLLTMLIVALSSLTAATSRNRTVGVLRVLGMTPRQIRALVAWEFAPVAASAVIVGVGLGLGLPYLVTAELDLRGFFGGNSPPQPALEPIWIVGAIAVFTVAVVAAVAVATAAGRRLAPAGVLKMGDE